MADKLLKQLDKLHPRLRALAPMSFWVTSVYATLNMAIGGTFLVAFHQVDRTDLIIVNTVTTFQFWGVVFVLLGLGKYWALYHNRWASTKRLMLAGVAVKTTWAIALFLRSLMIPGTMLVAALWVALAVIQIITVIYFVPSFNGEDKKDVGRKLDERDL